MGALLSHGHPEVVDADLADYLTPVHPLVVPGHTAVMLSGAFFPMPAVAIFTSRFNAFFLEALDECNHLVLFSFAHLKFCQSCGGVS